MDVQEPPRCEYVSSFDGLRCELFEEHESPHVVIEVVSPASEER